MIPLPVIQRGLFTLDRELFKASIPVVAVRIPAGLTMECKKVFGKDLLLEPKIRSVVSSDDGDKNKRLMLMSLNLQDIALTGASESTLAYIKDKDLEITQTQLEVGYDYYSADDILRAALPLEFSEEAPSSFTIVGHIAHMNLRDEYLPWKHLIGQVILDKNPKLRTVVNKMDSIDTTFRFFKMEVLCGVDDMIAEVRESGCRFKFDFSQVYWNSRLHTEHDRLVNMFKKTDSICDVMAGVGPFAMPAAKKGCRVYANDLNPVSYKYMMENAKLNKIQKNLFLYNMDGRDFIKKAVQDLEEASNHNNRVVPTTSTLKTDLTTTNTVTTASSSSANTENTSQQSIGAPSSFKTFDHFVMNLPGTAIEFLDAFRGLFRGKEALITNPSKELPMVHCHCFSKSEDPDQDVKERVEAVMGGTLAKDGFSLHWVRKVAPNKDMYCISFRLTPEIAFATSNAKRKADDAGEDEVAVDSEVIQKESMATAASSSSGEEESSSGTTTKRTKK